MSIYSGFPTRKDQTNYNHLLEKLIRTLQNQVLELIQSQGIPLPKSSTYEKIIIKMRQYEEHKYLQPKFSQLLQPIATLIGLPQKLDIIPEHIQSKFSISHTNSRLKSQTSNSIFSRKKPYNDFITSQQKQAKSSDNKHSQNLWKTKTKMVSPQNKNTNEIFRKTSNQKHRYHQSFYALHEKKLNKINRIYNKKIQEQKKHIENEEKHKLKQYRSTTEPETLLPTTKNQREYCIDLKILKEAEEELKQPRQYDKIYRITHQVTFGP